MTIASIRDFPLFELAKHSPKKAIGSKGIRPSNRIRKYQQLRPQDMRIKTHDF